MNNKILNIPHFVSQTQRASFSSSVTDQDESDPETEARDSIEIAEDGAIGLEDDGKSGKLTLSILLSEKLIEPGEGVMSIDYLGQTFKGDLLPMGKIRSVETGLIFNNPSAWAIYCKKIINPAKKSGCGWASVKYRGKKMDYFKNIWVKRKAAREADMAKTEAAHALTFLSEGIISEQRRAASPQPAAVNLVTQSFSSASTDPSDLFIELDNWDQDRRMQPFNLSVGSSALLVLDLHAHLSVERATGYLAGIWDLNRNHLAITHAYPCLLNRDQVGSEEAKRVETRIYEDLYSRHLSLVGWYHTSTHGPAAPTARDCSTQLELQIKMLGNTEVNYSPSIGLICSPYDQTARSQESSIVFYWVYPPAGESHVQDFGRPMRMSYDFVKDPYLSADVLQLLDDIIDFHNKQPKKIQIPLIEKYDERITFIEKIVTSLMSKFPGDQNETKMKMYFMSELLGGDSYLEKFLETQTQSARVQLPTQPLPQTEMVKRNEEEEIDDDEETALNEQEEIDDDEDTALCQSGTQALTSLISSLGTTMTFTKGSEGGQETVNLSIKDTDISLPDINIREAENQEKHEEDSDDDESRLIIKE